MSKQFIYSLLLLGNVVLAPNLFAACPTLQINYSRDVDWTASVSYTPCGKKEQEIYLATKWSGNNIAIEPGTDVSIGPKWTTKHYVDISKTSGSWYQVGCTGTMNPIIRNGITPESWPDCKLEKHS